MHRRAIYTLLLVFVSTTLWSQYLENYEKRALKAFHSKDYQSALLFSEKVLDIDSFSVASLFMAGEAARMSGDLPKAEAYLSRIPDGAKLGYYAVADFQLATVKQDLNKLDEAKALFEKYMREHADPNDLFNYLALEAIKSLERGGKRDLAADLGFRRLPNNINSPAAESAPLRYAEKLYFTSSETQAQTVAAKGKKGQKRNSKQAKAPVVTRIYEARLNYPAQLFGGNPADQNLSAGNLSLLPDASRVFYTICKGELAKAEGCEIWTRERTYEGDWGPPRRLPEQVNQKDASSTQPTIAWDKTKKQFVLYFASDRPGGRGGMDIWCAAMRRDGSFEAPFNLPFNTPKDDVTPFYHQSSQVLFFSSNGWPGEGGFDIFRERRTDGGEWKTPENLGELLNSAYDDTYYSFHTQSQKAYLVSNRPGSNCVEPTNEECFDIYEASIFVDLNLVVLRSRDNSPVYGSQVEVKDLATNESGSFVARRNDNRIPLRLEAGRRYLLTFHVQGYEPYTFEFSTEDISYFVELERQVYLKRPVEP